MPPAYIIPPPQCISCMTRLVTDPGNIELQVPEASSAHVKYIRIVGQVTCYQEGCLYLAKIQSLPDTVVALDGPPETSRLLAVDVDLSVQLTYRETEVGAVINVRASYDGDHVVAYEVYAIEGTQLVGHLDTLAAMAQLGDL